MANDLGTIRGQLVLDVKKALAGYTQARQAHVATVTALRTGGAALKDVGTGMMAAGGAIAAGLVYATNAAAKFERKLDYFGAISGTTGKEFDAVRDKALQLGKDTIFSADQVADAFVELGKAGVSAKDIVAGVGEGVTSLASAADIPLDTAANIMLAAVQTFGLSADSAVSVADKLSGAANASMVDVQDLGTSFKYAGGVAHAMGLSFDDVNTALALLGKYGIKGSTAGTSLRQILVSLPGATKAATNELKDLGIITKDGANKFFDAQGKIKPLPKIFDILKKSTKGLTQEQKIQAYKTIFQSRALSTALALTNEGAKGFDTMAKSINKTKAADVAAKRLDNLSGDIEILKGNLETLAIEIGTIIQPFARSVVGAVTDIVQAFIDLPDGVKQTIIIVLAVVAAFLILVGIGVTIAGVILSITATIFVLGPVLAGIGAFISAVVGGFLSLGGALLAFLGPVGIVIAIIAVIVAALVWFFTQTEVGKTAWANFCKFLAEAWTNIVSVATSVWGGIVSFFEGIWNGIISGVTAFIALAVSNFLNFTPLGLIISHWGEIVGFFTTLWSNIISGIQAFIAFTISAFVNFPTNIAAFFNMLPGLIGYAIGLLLGVIVRGILAIGVFLFTTVPTFIIGVVGFFQALPGQVLAFIVTLVTGVIINWLLFVARVNAIVGAGIAAVVGFFQSLPARVLGFILTMVANGVSAFNRFRALVVAATALIIAGIVGFLQGLPGRVGGFFNAAVQAGAKAWNAAVAMGARVVTNVISGIRKGLDALPGLVSGIFNRAVDAIKTVITGAFNAAHDFAAGLWNGFKKGLGINSPSLIEKQMTQITQVTHDETGRLKGQITTLQRLGMGINSIGEGIGDNWNGQMSTSLQDLYSTVAATKALDAQMAGRKGLNLVAGVGPAGGANPTPAQAAPAEVNYNIEVHNPAPEKASDTLPRSIRQVAYMVG